MQTIESGCVNAYLRGCVASILLLGCCLNVCDIPAAVQACRCNPPSSVSINRMSTIPLNFLKSPTVQSCYPIHLEHHICLQPKEIEAQNKGPIGRQELGHRFRKWDWWIPESGQVVEMHMGSPHRFEATVEADMPPHLYPTVSKIATA